jgi:short-subunit dehydrogenase
MEKRLGLVTGASSGLGEHLAGCLAADGHDVVLVARSVGKLEALAKSLSARGVQAHVLPADLTGRSAPQALFDELSRRNLRVDFLLNNAGFGSHGSFLELPLKEEVDMVELNVVALMQLCQLFGRGMRERKFGRILNIASTAGFQPGPFMATYYATKSFVLSFSRALSYELRGSGVTVTAHCPGPTATGFAARAGNDKSTLFKTANVATAEETAQHAYRAMQKGKELSVHGMVNRIGARAALLSPGLGRTVAARMNQVRS